MKKIFLGLFFFLVCLTLQAQSKPIITVLDFEIDGVSEGEMKSIVFFLSDTIFKTDKYQVIDSSQRNTLLSEMDFAMSGCTDEACQLQMGKMLAAQFIVVGSLGKVGSRIMFSARMLDVETSRMVSSSSGIYKSIDDLLDNLERFAEELTGAEITKKDTDAEEREKEKEREKKLAEEEKDAEAKRLADIAAKKQAEKAAKEQATKEQAEREAREKAEAERKAAERKKREEERASRRANFDPWRQGGLDLYFSGDLPLSHYNGNSYAHLGAGGRFYFPLGSGLGRYLQAFVGLSATGQRIDNEEGSSSSFLYDFASFSFLRLVIGLKAQVNIKRLNLFARAAYNLTGLQEKYGKNTTEVSFWHYGSGFSIGGGVGFYIFPIWEIFAECNYHFAAIGDSGDIFNFLQPGIGTRISFFGFKKKGAE